MALACPAENRTQLTQQQLEVARQQAMAGVPSSAF